MATPADLAFLATMLQSPGDRRACVTLLAGPRAAARTPLAEFQSVKVQRSVSHGPRRIYRVYGSGGVEAPAEVRRRGERVPRAAPETPARPQPPRAPALRSHKARPPRPTPNPPTSLSPSPSPQVALEALSNLSLIPAWDLLFKGARYLEWSREEAGGGAVEVGRIHLVYGLPGACA